jgi:hypothetical protein
MSAKERKMRRQRHPMAARATTVGGETAPRVSRMPQWQWKTFPVYFMFSLGLFIGVYAGSLTTAFGNSQDNWTPQIVVFIGSALLMGFGFSRLMTRLMVSRQWIKPRRRQP